jgi:thioredoxin 1
MPENHSNLFLVSDQEFEQRVLQSELPVIVDFTADWCPPCRVLAPLYARLSDTYEGRLRFAKMDVDENTDTPAHYGVQGCPTLLLFARGKLAGRLVGPPPARLSQSIERLFSELHAGEAQR